MTEARPLRPLRVLVVEDSEADYELLLYTLKRARYDVQARRVDDERSMREALADGLWDVVISDHRLPTFSASAALRTLQSCGCEVPFIIVSGAIGEDIAVEAMQAGADDYILKDRLARLIPAIERCMKASEARQRQRAAEAALRESESRLRAITANLPGMLFCMHTNEEGEPLAFTYASEASERLFGVPPQTLLEDPHSLHRLIVEADRLRFDTALAHAALARVRLGWEGRATARTPQGTVERWVQIEASPRQGDRPGDLVWDGLISDISALKHAQAELYASRDELRRLSGHLERAKEQERARIAREIHDDIGGTLTGLRADLAWIKKRYGHDPNLAEKLESMSALLDSAMQASVRIARDLRPPILDFGFTAAIEWQAKDFQKRTGVQCRFRCDGDITLDTDRATAVFRIFQELLTNIAKHAQASRVNVRLEQNGSVLRLEVEDDGIGLTEEDRAKRGSYGIRGMLERARELNGRLVFHRPPRGGTRAILELPLASSTGE